ncbi:hypothetical protein GCM10023405_19490 [Streptomonospora salina]
MRRTLGGKPARSRGELRPIAAAIVVARTGGVSRGSWGSRSAPLLPRRGVLPRTEAARQLQLSGVGDGPRGRRIRGDRCLRAVPTPSCRAPQAERNDAGT